MKGRTGGALILAGLLGLAATAGADLVVGDNSQTGSRDCGGGAATVGGNLNKLTFRNCSRLSVLGNNNVLEAGPVAEISLLGNGNRVSWAPGPGGRQPQVTDLGNGNRVSQGSSQPPDASRRGGREGADVKVDKGGTTVSAGGSTVKVDKGGVTIGGPEGSVRVDAGGVGARRSGRGDVVIDEGDLTQTHDCGGGAAVVNGGDNVLTFRNCNSVTITGAGNQVTAVGAASIRVEGNDNEVTWSPGPDGRRPRITNVGSNNTITQAK